MTYTREHPHLIYIMGATGSHNPKPEWLFWLDLRQPDWGIALTDLQNRAFIGQENVNPMWRPDINIYKTPRLSESFLTRTEPTAYIRYTLTHPTTRLHDSLTTAAAHDILRKLCFSALPAYRLHVGSECRRRNVGVFTAQVCLLI